MVVIVERPYLPQTNLMFGDNQELVTRRFAMIGLMKRLLLSLVVMCILAPISATAQGFIAEEVQILLDPRYPAPNESFTAELRDFGIRGVSGAIGWIIDGEVLDSSDRTITLQAPPLGETVRIQALRGSEIVAEEIVRPAYLDVIVEPLTHTPSWFAGRSLASPRSFVRLSAVVEESDRQPANAYTYTWQIDQLMYGGGALPSGQQITVQLPDRRAVLVYVTVSRPGVGTVARRIIQIPTQRPQLLFYPTNQIIFPRPIEGSYQMRNSELTLVAEPLYMSSESLDRPFELHSEWKLNGRTVTPSGNLRQLTVQRAGGTGSARVEYQLVDREQLLQGARGSVRIQY